VPLAAADELLLKNGDRLTGRVISLDKGTLKFKTEGGDLKIAWEEVVSVTVDEEIIATSADGKTVNIKSGPVDVAATTKLERPKPPLVWDGGAGAGFFASGGNTQVNSLQLNGDLLVHNSIHRYTVGALANRAEEAGRDTARNWTISGGYDRFFTTRVYLNSSSILTNDEFRDIHLRTALSIGVGVQVIDTSRVTMALEGGIGWVNEDYIVAEDDEYTSARESGRLDVFFGGEKVVLFHRHDGYFGVTGNDNLFIKMQNGIRLALVAGFAAAAQMNFDYDRSPAPGRRNIDRTVAITLGYRF
jgi:putative salt-induced outer membrane protein YdiY